MVTVKDLIEYLNQYNMSTPVYWGVDTLPCWEAKKNATIKDFPVKEDGVDVRPFFNRFLYFGDYQEYDKLIDDYFNLKREWEDKSLYAYIKHWIQHRKWKIENWWINL